MKQKSFALRQATAHNENKEKNSFLKSNTGYADPSTSEAKKEEKERAYLTTYMRSRMKKGKQKKKKTVQKATINQGTAPSKSRAPRSFPSAETKTIR